MKILVTECITIPSGNHCNGHTTCQYLHKIQFCTLFHKDLDKSKENTFTSRHISRVFKCNKCLKLKHNDALRRHNCDAKKITEKKFSNCPHKDHCNIIDGSAAKQFRKNLNNPDAFKMDSETKQKLDKLISSPPNPDIVNKLIKNQVIK